MERRLHNQLREEAYASPLSHLDTIATLTGVTISAAEAKVLRQRPWQPKSADGVRVHTKILSGVLERVATSLAEV